MTDRLHTNKINRNTYAHTYTGARSYFKVLRRSNLFRPLRSDRYNSIAERGINATLLHNAFDDEQFHGALAGAQ